MDFLKIFFFCKKIELNRIKISIWLVVYKYLIKIQLEILVGLQNYRTLSHSFANLPLEEY